MLNSNFSCKFAFFFVPLSRNLRSVDFFELPLKLLELLKLLKLNKTYQSYDNDKKPIANRSCCVST